MTKLKAYGVIAILSLLSLVFCLLGVHLLRSNVVVGVSMIGILFSIFGVSSSMIAARVAKIYVLEDRDRGK